jgi:single-strand DNA-binding protein
LSLTGQGNCRQPHVNVVGRVQNNNYEREGETVYSLAFTAEEIDYLDSKAEGEALRAKQGPAGGEGDGDDDGDGARESAGTGKDKPANAAKPKRSRKTEDVPF